MVLPVAGHRVFSTKQPDGTLHGFIIEEQIVVHQVTLDASPLHTQRSRLMPSIKNSRVVRCMVYAPTSQMRFSSSSLHLNEPVLFGQVFVLHGNVLYRYSRIASDIDITEGLAVVQRVFIV